jgi:hypothetical protein
MQASVQNDVTGARPILTICESVKACPFASVFRSASMADARRSRASIYGFRLLGSGLKEEEA